MQRTTLGYAVFLVLVGCRGGSLSPDGGGGVAGTGGGGAPGTGGGAAGAGGAVAGTGGAVAGTGGGEAGAGGAAGGGGAAGAAGEGWVTFASADAIAFAAAQDGDGPWQAFAGGVGPNYALQVTGQRYGIAYVCGNTLTDTRIFVIQATVAEATRVTVACGISNGLPPMVTITGTVGGLEANQAADIVFSPRGAGVSAARPTFSMAVPEGTWDLFALRRPGSPVYDRVIRRNAVTAVAGATFNLDFATEGFASETRTVTFDGLSGAETTSLSVLFRNTLGGSSFNSGFPSGVYSAIPASQLRAGDYHSILAEASGPGLGTRRVRRIYTAAMDFTAVFPPMIAAPAFSVGETTPYLRPRATIPPGLASDRYDVAYSQSASPPVGERTWTLQLTRRWIEAAGVADYTVPDLSTVAGFEARWGLAPGVTAWQQLSQSSDAGAADLLRADQTAAELDGREYKSTQRGGYVTF